jgi:hypothetical protein
MDDLIEIAKRLDDGLLRFASETEDQAKARRNQAIRDAATALRASAEREKELVEALEKIKADSDAFSDAFYGGHNLWDGGYESGLEHCAEIARAALSTERRP